MTQVEQIKELVAKNSGTTVALAKEIWGYAELSYEEFKSSAALIAALREQGFQKLPDLYALKNEYKQLAEQKDQMQRQYNDAKRQMQEYGIIKQNVDGILRIAPGKEQMQER